MGETKNPARSRRRRMLIVGGRTLLIGLLVWSIGVWLIQRRVMFPSHMTGPVAAEPPRRAGIEVGHIEIDDGRVEWWFIPGHGVGADQPGPVVLFAHGNAETIDDTLPYVEMLYNPLGVSVMLVEYRGYGRSDGSPSQAGLTADFMAAYRQLAERPDVDAERIVLHGRSIGTGVIGQVAAATAAADDLPEPAAVILLSPMRNIPTLARQFLVPPLLIRDKFDTASALADFHPPVLLLHGRRDNIIPADHSHALHEIIPNSELVEFDSGHNDVPVMSREYVDVIRTFLEKNGVIGRDKGT